MNESKISQHLARRDGELALISSDLETDERLLDALNELKDELNSAADVELGQRDWQLEAERWNSTHQVAQKQPTSLFVQHPMATAASVLFAAAIFVVGIGVDWQGTGGQVDLAEAQLVTATNDPLPALIARSQDLENLAQISGGWSGVTPAQTENETQLTRLILMQVAAIDDRLSSMNGQGDRARERMLWQRRVSLLEAYNAAIENANPDLSRSM